MISPEGNGLAFIISLPRSGSTLLSALLNRLHGVYCPPEPWIVAQTLAAYSEEAVGTFINAAGNRAIKEHFRNQFPYDPARAFILSSYNALLEKNHCKVFVDKTPRNVLFPELLPLVFPNAHFIVLVRHPLDVAVSFRDTWGVPTEVLAGTSLQPETADWVLGVPSLVQWCQQDLAHRIVVSYEDLTRSPDDQIARLSAFLGLGSPETKSFGDLDSTMLAAFREAAAGDKKILNTTRVHRDSVDRWKSSLSQGEVEALVKSVGTDVFNNLGYPDVLDYLTDVGLHLPKKGSSNTDRRTFLRDWDCALANRIEIAERKNQELLSSLAQFNTSHKTLQELAEKRETLLNETLAREKAVCLVNETLRTQLLEVETKLSLTTAQFEEYKATQAIESEIRLTREAEQGDLQSHVDRLNKEVRSLAATEAEQLSYISSLKAQLEATQQQHEQFIRDRKNDFQNAEKELADLRLSHEHSIQQDAISRKSLQSHIDRLNKEVLHLSEIGREQLAFISLLKSQLEALQKEREERIQLHQNQLQSREKELTELRLSRARLLHEEAASRDSLQAHIDRLNTELNQLAAVSKEQKAYISSLEAQCQNLEQTKQKLNEDSLRLCQKLDEHARMIEQLEKTVRIDSMQLLDKQNRLDVAEIEIQRVNHLLDELQGKKVEVEDELTATRTTLEIARGNEQRLSNDLVAANTRASQLGIEVSQAQSKIEQLNAQLAAGQSERNSLLFAIQKHNALLARYQNRKRVLLLNRSGVLPTIPFVPEASEEKLP